LRNARKIVRNQVICIYSELTETELVNAPTNVKNYFKELPKESLEKVEINDDILALANKFDTVKTFRKIKDKISKDLEGMSFDEIKEYFKRQSSKLQTE